MIEPGRRAAARLLERARPDAVFCANDLLASGLWPRFRDAGLAVPDDVAVVGMDNTSLCDVTWPPLTSVDLGSAERARLAAELLVQADRAAGPAPARRSASTRASSSAPPAGPRRDDRPGAASELRLPRLGPPAAAPASASRAARRCCC